MLKILLVSSEFPPGPGGIGRHAADLCLALVSKGCNVDVYTNIDYVNKSDLENFKKELPDKIKLYHFRRLGFLTYPLRIIKVLKAIRKKKYDRFVFTGKFPLWTGAIIKVLYSRLKKIEFFVHGSEINPGNRLSRTLTHWALCRADTIWAVSEFTRSILPEKVKFTKIIRILPNGIHSSEWPPSESVEPFAGWKGYPKLLTVGSISPRKGQHRVIKALPALIEQFPDIHYHVVGMDMNAGYLRKLINDQKVNDHVSLHGRLPGKGELAKAYKTCDIYIMLSENQPDGDVEGFGISILEANLYGLPAVGARDCGIEDAIKPGVNGELVDGNDPGEITRAVMKILNQRDNYLQDMKDWVTCHDWNVLIDEFLQAE